MSGAFSRPTKSRVSSGFRGNGNFNGYPFTSQNNNNSRFNNNSNGFQNNNNAQPNNFDGSFPNNAQDNFNNKDNKENPLSLVVSTVPWERKNKLSWHDKQILGNVAQLICWNCDGRGQDKLLIAMSFAGLFAFGDAAIDALENQAKYMHPTNPLEQGVYSFGHGIVAKAKEHPNIVASEEDFADFCYHFLIANVYSIHLSSVVETEMSNAERYFGDIERRNFFCALCNFVEERILEKVTGLPLVNNNNLPEGAGEIDTTSVFTIKKSFISLLFNKQFLFLTNWEPNWRAMVHPTGDLDILHEGYIASYNDDFVPLGVGIGLPPLAVVQKRVDDPKARDYFEAFKARKLEARRNGVLFAGSLDDIAVRLVRGTSAVTTNPYGDRTKNGDVAFAELPTVAKEMVGARLNSDQIKADNLFTKSNARRITLSKFEQNILPFSHPRDIHLDETEKLDKQNEFIEDYVVRREIAKRVFEENPNQ